MNNRIIPKLNVIISMIIFGTIGIFVRHIPLSSSAIALSRAIIGTLFLLAILIIKRSKTSFKDLRKNLIYLILSGTLIAVNWIMLFEAYRYTSVAVATVCYYLAPIFVLIASPIILKEKLTVIKTISIFTALIGAIFVSGVFQSGTDANINIKGILFGIIAAIFYAGVIILNKKIKGLKAFDITILQLAVSAIVLLPYTLLTSKIEASAFTSNTVILLIIVGIVHTGIAYTLYFSSIKALKAQTVAIFSYIDPVVAIFLSIALLGEKLDVLSIIGSIMILSATVISEFINTKKDNETMEFKAKNPIADGWYADPEARYYEGKYWIYVTISDPVYENQMNLTSFSSIDGNSWEKHENIVCLEDFPHIYRAVWAPTIIDKDGKYYLIFASNDIQSDNEVGGLEVAVSDTPLGPFRKHCNTLVDKFINKAQPIDAHLFKDTDGTIYLYYGGWGHCNVAIMNDTMDGFKPLPNGETFLEITPPDYVEGPCMLKHDDNYYFMWSSGGWGDGSYRVNYCSAKSPLGPFEENTTILQSQPPLAEGPGHHGYIQTDDKLLIVYHRRIIGDTNAGHRVLCIDKLEIENGEIKPVIMT